MLLLACAILLLSVPYAHSECLAGGEQCPGRDMLLQFTAPSHPPIIGSQKIRYDSRDDYDAQREQSRLMACKRSDDDSSKLGWLVGKFTSLFQGAKSEEQLKCETVCKKILRRQREDDCRPNIPTNLQLLSSRSRREELDRQLRYLCKTFGPYICQDQQGVAGKFKRVLIESKEKEAVGHGFASPDDQPQNIQQPAAPKGLGRSKTTSALSKPVVGGGEIDSVFDKKSSVGAGEDQPKAKAGVPKGTSSQSPALMDSALKRLNSDCPPLVIFVDNSKEMRSFKSSINEKFFELLGKTIHSLQTLLQKIHTKPGENATTSGGS